jgi:Leucine-rich repeat (LRR) protein
MITCIDIDNKTIEHKYYENALSVCFNSSKIKHIISISNFNCLEKLELICVSLKDMPDFKHLLNLKELTFCSNDIEKITGLTFCTSLEKLNLSSKHITKIEGLDTLINLRSLDLQDNKITEIEGLQSLTSLQELDLSYNLITKIKGLDNLINLKILHLHHNEIIKIENLDKLTNLKELYLNNNSIQEIQGLENQTKLENFDLTNNEIKEIKSLDHLIKLKRLYLNYNLISEIKNISELKNLTTLNMRNNKISEIKNIHGLNSLQELFLDNEKGPRIYDYHLFLHNYYTNKYEDRNKSCNNTIKQIPLVIMSLKNLKTLKIDCEINPIIKRFLNKNLVSEGKTIYDDKQNVHDSEIVKSIQQSIYNIMSESIKSSSDQTFDEIIADNILNDQTKTQLIEYCQDKTVHSVINVTFSEVLLHVWHIISERKNDKEESNEIKKILNAEMTDSICKCFTGRLSRLINCLNGFDSRVSLKISDNQQILNIIIGIRNKFDDVNKQKEIAEKELNERGYDKNTIDEYLIYLE